MRKYFINYRPEDSQQADLLRSFADLHLQKAGEVLWTEANLALSGPDLARDIRQRLISCDAVLALIGPTWAAAHDTVSGAPASFDHDDPVHCGIATALSIGVPVIPVLVNGGALPPPKEVPVELQALGYRATSVIRDKKFKSDSRRLFRRLTPQKLGRKILSGNRLSDTGQHAWTSRLVALSLVAAASVAATLFVNRASLQAMGAELKANAFEMVRALATSSSVQTSSEWGSGNRPTDPPRPAINAVDDEYTIEAGATLAFNPEGNDTPGLQPPLKLATINASPVGTGNVVQLANGGTLRITGTGLEFVTGPTGNPEEFAYTVADGDGQTAQARVTIRIASSLASPTQKPPKAFRDCPDCPEMVLVPGGAFLMGSPPGEVGRFDDEGPQHRVQIKAFAAGKYEVTWDEYDACVLAGACASAKDDGFGKGARPVTNVSWDDAKSYARWLSVDTGKRYRLLSEADWEYAARARTNTAFSVGRTIAASQANFDATKIYGDGQAGEARAKTLPVGAFLSNAFGLFDMHGNVLEWIEDCYAANYSAGQPLDGAPFAPEACTYRIARGGSWSNGPSLLRSALRGGEPPEVRFNNLGFRIARDAK